MKPTVRDAQGDEADVLLEVLLKAYSEYQGRLDPPSGAHSETVESVKSRLEEGGAIVCEVEGAVAGCVFYAPKTDFMYVGRLAVLPQYRRRGIGEILLRAAERRAGELGLDRVRLGVRIRLEGLHAYYKERGYVVVGFESHAGYTEPTVVEMEKAVHGLSA